MTMKKITFATLLAFTPVMGVAQESSSENEVIDVTPAEVLMIDTTQDGFVPFKCPIEKIRSAYQDLVNPEDTLVALAIEKQTLAICRQSQEALIRIAENEVRLNDLFEPIIAPPAPEPVPEQVVEAPSEAEEGEDGGVLVIPDIIEVAPEPEPQVEAEPEFIPPNYAVAAIMKDPIGWKAMIVDGSAIFTVRPGDRMDDGSTIISIERGKVELLSEDSHSFFLE